MAQISPTDATKLCNNYDAKCNQLSRSINSEEDNRSCLFTLTELKNYIEYLEKSTENIDGIRIHLGCYGNNNLSPSKNNLTTMFLAPTSNGVDNTKLNALNLGSQGDPPKKKYGEQ